MFQTWSLLISPISVIYTVTYLLFIIQTSSSSSSAADSSRDISSVTSLLCLMGKDPASVTVKSVREIIICALSPPYGYGTYRLIASFFVTRIYLWPGSAVFCVISSIFAGFGKSSYGSCAPLRRIFGRLFFTCLPVTAN